MSLTPAVLDSDFRASLPRAPSEESRPSTDAKFQDAVDSRRAERAQSAAKNEDRRDARERVNGREDVSEDSEVGRSDALEESETEAPEAQAGTEPEERAPARESREPRNEAGEPESIHQDGAPRRALRAPPDGRPIGSTEHRGEVGSSALAIPWLGQTALEAVLATALPHALQSGSNALAPGAPSAAGSSSANGPANVLPSASVGRVATRIAPGQASLNEQPVAALKASTAIAIENHVLQHVARDAESPTSAVDPRAALAALGAPPPAEVAASPELVTARLTPAELPSFLERLAVHIDGPERSALVQLEPADLGPLSISLSLEPGGHVRAEMHAQRTEGYAALEARLPELHKSLIDRGFTSASVNLSLGLADPSAGRSGARDEHWKSTSAGRRTLAEAEVRAMLPASLGAIDMWA